MSHGSIDFNVSDVDENINEIAGHDSYEFNKAIMKGGRYINKQPMIFDVANSEDCDDNVVSVASNQELFELADYDEMFKSNDFLTSTVLDEINASHNFDQLHDCIVLSKLSKIESEMHSFVESTFKKIKEVVTAASKNLNMRHVSGKHLRINLFMFMF